jgi:NAD(P)-dependent dehydrogenase (short-subunit alcohol dehydrogenase family)
LQLASDFARLLPEGARGAIINIIDQKVLRLNPRYFSYTLSKSAFWTATQTMAQAYAPRIRVNAVGPGPVLPNHVEGIAGFEKEAAAVLLGSSVDPQEIADAVIYLVHARSVTGQMIAVDAGQHLAWKTPDVPEH